MRRALLPALLVLAACGGGVEVRRTYHANGKPWTEVRFRKGKCDGPFTTWYASGRKSTEGANLGGQLDGKYTEWHEDGTVVLEASYKTGLLDGPWHERWSDGRDRCVANYKDGRLDGQYADHDESGQRLHEGRFVAGLREGLWTMYSLVDRKDHKVEYSHGDLKSDLDREKSKGAGLLADPASSPEKQ